MGWKKGRKTRSTKWQWPVSSQLSFYFSRVLIIQCYPFPNSKANGDCRIRYNTVRRKFPVVSSSGGKMHKTAVDDQAFVTGCADSTDTDWTWVLVFKGSLFWIQHGLVFKSPGWVRLWWVLHNNVFAVAGENKTTWKIEITWNPTERQETTPSSTVHFGRPGTGHWPFFLLACFLVLSQGIPGSLFASLLNV